LRKAGENESALPALFSFGNISSSLDQAEISQLLAIQVKTAKQQKHQKNQEKINQKMSKTNQIQTELNKINRQQIIKELQNELNEKFHTNITISEQALAREETPAEQT